MSISRRSVERFLAALDPVKDTFSASGAAHARFRKVLILPGDFLRKWRSAQSLLTRCKMVLPNSHLEGSTIISVRHVDPFGQEEGAKKQ